jgi:hypothetical protein
MVLYSECENRKSLNNMDMLCRCGKVLKHNERNTNEATSYTYKYTWNYFNELGFMSALQA